MRELGECRRAITFRIRALEGSSALSRHAELDPTKESYEIRNK
jgi:hypothetical protein